MHNCIIIYFQKIRFSEYQDIESSKTRNTRLSSFGRCDVPPDIGQNMFCGHKSTTCLYCFVSTKVQLAIFVLSAQKHNLLFVPLDYTTTCKIPHLWYMVVHVWNSPAYQERKKTTRPKKAWRRSFSMYLKISL